MPSKSPPPARFTGKANQCLAVITKGPVTIEINDPSSTIVPVSVLILTIVHLAMVFQTRETKSDFIVPILSLQLKSTEKRLIGAPYMLSVEVLYPAKVFGIGVQAVDFYGLLMRGHALVIKARSSSKTIQRIIRTVDIMAIQKVNATIYYLKTK
jgi:hypothetical protein